MFISKVHKIIKTKIHLFVPGFIFSTIIFLEFWKQNFMYFGHKYVESGPNCSHEFATFLKYHMPLRACTTSIKKLLSLVFSTLFINNNNFLLKCWEMIKDLLRQVPRLFFRFIN